ncbi:MAG: winged helix-turn-helix domain-containing protein, partial [Sulfuricurvum sp.]|nr:winged helix-turn-helix domain-containing protein [Sulfuricurvum sp.]
SIDVLISRIRQKIESNPKHPILIRSIRGMGYQFSK